MSAMTASNTLAVILLLMQGKLDDIWLYVVMMIGYSEV